MKALLDEYNRALLIFGKGKNGHFNRDNSSKRRIQVKTWKGVIALERHLFLNGYHKAFSLISENCALCKECSYPAKCKFPEYKRPSVESCAIDIFKTLEKLGKPVNIVKDVNDEYNSYSIILLD